MKLLLFVIWYDSYEFTRELLKKIEWDEYKNLKKFWQMFNAVNFDSSCHINSHKNLKLASSLML